MYRYVLAGFVTIAVTPALADQCLWNSRPVADQAAKLLPKGTVVQAFCAPCDEKVATRVVVDTVAVTKVPDEQQYFMVEINREAYDLAYVYIMAGQGKAEWTNVGHLTSCIQDLDTPRILPPGVEAK